MTVNFENQPQVYRITRKGISPGAHIEVTAPDGTLVVGIRGKPLIIVRESYEVATPPGVEPLTVKQKTVIRGPEFSIYKGNSKVGSACVSTGHGKGFVHLLNTPRMEVSFGWVFKREFSLEAADGSFGHVSDDGHGWSVQLENLESSLVFLLGLAIVYGEYLKRD